MKTLALNFQAVYDPMLGLFAKATGVGISLHAGNGEEMVGYHGTPEPVFCDAIRELLGSHTPCNADQCRRATLYGGPDASLFSLCHAGLFNIVEPIIAHGDVVGSIVVGPLRLSSPVRTKAGLERLDEFLKTWGANKGDASRIRETYESVVSLVEEDLGDLRSASLSLRSVIGALWEEETRQGKAVIDVSHEIQQQLTAVLANALNLEAETEELTTSQVEKRVKSLANAVRGLNTVVMSFWEYVEEYRFAQQAVAPLVREAVDMYSEQASYRGIEIQLHLDPNDRKTEAQISKRHVQIAINNLVHNAVKYSYCGTDSRHRYVSVAVRSSSGKVIFAVENYGVGIRPEEISTGAIFAPHYKGMLARGEYRTGRGYGLTYVKEVADKHHGEVVVTSQRTSDSDSFDIPHITKFMLILPKRQPVASSGLEGKTRE